MSDRLDDLLKAALEAAPRRPIGQKLLKAIKVSRRTLAKSDGKLQEVERQLERYLRTLGRTSRKRSRARGR